MRVLEERNHKLMAGVTASHITYCWAAKGATLCFPSSVMR